MSPKWVSVSCFAFSINFEFYDCAFELKKYFSIYTQIAPGCPAYAIQMGWATWTAAVGSSNIKETQPGLNLYSSALSFRKCKLFKVLHTNKKM